MINFQKLFEDLPEILPQMDFKKKGSKLYSKFNADGTTPKHSRPDKTVVKTLSGIIVAAENGGWGCHRVTELMKLHFSEPQLREILARYSVENQNVTPHRLPKIDYERQALAVEFIEDCHKYLGKDGDLCNYLNTRGLRIDEVYEKTNIGGYSLENSIACERLKKLCENFDEFQRLNTCKSIVLPLFSRGVLSGIAFRYIKDNQQRKCEKIRLFSRFGGLCFQHSLPQKDIDAVCVVEGEFDAISGNLAGLSNIHFVATCGPANAENAIKELRAIYPHADIFAAFDNDNTGSDYTAKFQAFDASIVDIRNAFQPSKDLNEFAAKGENFEKIQETIFAHRREIFEKKSFREELENQSTDYATTLPILTNGKFEALTIPIGVTVIAAPTGHGKSTILQNMALREASNNRHVLYITLEESRANVLTYMFAAFCYSRAKNLTVADIQRLRGDLSRSNEKEIEEFDTLLTQRLTVSRYENTIERLCADIIQFSKRELVHTIYVDYIQMLDTEDTNTRRELQVKAIMKQLRELTDTLHVRVIAAAQFNRTGSRFGEQTLSNLGEAGDIERAATLVVSCFQLAQIEEHAAAEILDTIGKQHAAAKYAAAKIIGGIPAHAATKSDLRGLVLIRILKNRNGAIGDSAIWSVDFSRRAILSKIAAEQYEIAPTTSADLEEISSTTPPAAYCDIF